MKLFVLAMALMGSGQSMKGMDHMTSPFMKEMNRSMAVMDRGMSSAPMNGNPDHDFASMMIPHHQGAIDMAKAELLHGTDPVLRRLAQEIIANQVQEIALMKRRLGQMAGTKIGKSATQAPTDCGVDPAKGDRVYTADQVSNTVSVIDPIENKLLGVIRLGDPVPASLSPLYRGELLVHGLGFSPDGKTLAVVSIGSNSVTFIDTATNRPKGKVYVGRAPHEAFFTPDGSELWCAVRGEDHVSVIDPIKFVEKRRIVTSNGPGMVMFSPDGKLAFVPSSFVPEMSVIDTQSYSVITRVKQFSPFCPNLAVSADGEQVWITLKDTGKTQVFSGHSPFSLLKTLDTGPITNHVTMVDNASGHFAFVSVGGLNEVKVFRRDAGFDLVKRIPTRDLPHGIWASPDGSKVFVGLENGGGVQEIDALSDKIVSTAQAGQLPQALVYVPHADSEGTGIKNLDPIGLASQAVHVRLRGPKAMGNVVVNSLGLVDSIQLSAEGLAPGKEFEMQIVRSPNGSSAGALSLAVFQSNPAGGALAQAIGPLKTVAPSTTSMERRYLRVIDRKTGQVVLKQSS